MTDEERLAEAKRNWEEACKAIPDGSEVIIFDFDALSDLVVREGSMSAIEACTFRDHMKPKE